MDKNKLLIVDDEANVLNSLRRLLRREKFQVLTTTSTQVALEILKKEAIQVVMADHKMPEMDGINFLLEIKKRYPEKVLILFTGYPEIQVAVRAVNEVGVFRLITKPWDEQVLIGAIHQSFRHNRGIEKDKKMPSQDLLKSIQYQTEMLESRIRYFQGHSQMVSRYAIMIAENLGMEKEEVEVVRLAGLFHDLGSVGIEDKILGKTDKLARKEFEIVKTHPIIGANILETLSFSPELILLVREHHERYDGKGYPEGKKGEEIHLGSRILNVAEAFEAMTSPRPYRLHPLSKEEAMEELSVCSGTQFDAQVAEAFIDCLRKK